jgi:hypothetical protein
VLINFTTEPIQTSASNGFVRHFIRASGRQFVRRYIRKSGRRPIMIFKVSSLMVLSSFIHASAIDNHLFHASSVITG